MPRTSSIPSPTTGRWVSRARAATAETSSSLSAKATHAISTRGVMTSRTLSRRRRMTPSIASRSRRSMDPSLADCARSAASSASSTTPPAPPPETSRPNGASMSRSISSEIGAATAQKRLVGTTASRADRARSAFPTSFGNTSAESTIPNSEIAAIATPKSTECSKRVTRTELTTRYAVLTTNEPSIVETSKMRGLPNRASIRTDARGCPRRSASRSAGVNAK